MVIVTVFFIFNQNPKTTVRCSYHQEYITYFLDEVTSSLFF